MSAFVDTNVLVRHLTGDPVDLAARATAYLEVETDPLLTDLVVAETHPLRFGGAHTGPAATVDLGLADPAA